MCNHSPHIVLGISGGIAAYKSLSLIRLFVQNGAQVKVVVTQNALQFVTELSLQTLSNNPVYVDPFQKVSQYDVEHIALAEWADLFVVAPATANVIAKFAHGIADDALSTLYLAMRCPTFVAPAMNVNMLEHPATQQNIDTLRQRGVQILEPDEGFLACGTHAKGRMQEPDIIATHLFDFLNKPKELAGKHVLVTAGPTYEPIDPVRFLGNYSSGLMGFALAEECAQRGATVTLVTGPTHLTTQVSNLERVNVKTAQEMLEMCQKYAEQADILIMAAAVADYTPATVAPEKIKKSDATMALNLKKTTDILATLALQRREGQCVVGFALETEQELANAKKKLENKKADIIVLNSLKQSGAGFQCPTNSVTIIDKRGNVVAGELKSKQAVAADIVSYLIEYQNKK